MKNVNQSQMHQAPSSQKTQDERNESLRSEGITLGINLAKHKIACNLFKKGFSIEQIAEITEFSIESVSELSTHFEADELYVDEQYFTKEKR